MELRYQNLVGQAHCEPGTTFAPCGPDSGREPSDSLGTRSSSNQRAGAPTERHRDIALYEAEVIPVCSLV